MDNEPPKQYQHVVPKFYLKQWAFDSSQEEVLVYDKNNRKLRKSKISAVAGQHNFYDIGLAKHSPFGKRFVERTLSTLEARHAIALAEFIGCVERREKISKKIKSRLAEFTALQLMRTKQIRSVIPRSIEFKELFDAKSSAHPIVEKMPQTLYVDECLAIVHSLKMAESIGGIPWKNESVKRDLYEYYNWVVAINNTGVGLITSDGPVVTFYTPGVNRVARLTLPHEVYLPITPKYGLLFFLKGLFAKDKRAQFSYEEVNDELLILSYNLKVFHFATRETYGHARKDLVGEDYEEK